MKLYNEPPDGTTEARFERRKALEVLRNTWTDNRPRSKRLADIDRRPLWDDKGHRIILAVQRHYTTYEVVLSGLTFPWLFWKMFRNFGKVITKAQETGLGGRWRIEDFEDPTVVIPTGAPIWLPGELRRDRPIPKDDFDDSDDEKGV